MSEETDAEQLLAEAPTSFVTVSDLVELVVSFMITPLPDVKSIKKHGTGYGSSSLYNPVSSLRYYSSGSDAGSNLWSQGVKDLYRSFQIVGMLRTVSRRWAWGCEGLHGALVRACTAVYETPEAVRYVKKCWEDECGEFSTGPRPSLLAKKKEVVTTRSSYSYGSRYSDIQIPAKSHPLDSVSKFWVKLGATEDYGRRGGGGGGGGAFEKLFIEVLQEQEQHYSQLEAEYRCVKASLDSSSGSGMGEEGKEQTEEELAASIAASLDRCWCMPSLYTIALIGLSATRWTQGFPSDALRRALKDNERLCKSADFETRMRDCCQPVVYVPGHTIQETNDPVTKLVLMSSGVVSVTIGAKEHCLRGGSRLGGGAFTPVALGKAVGARRAMAAAELAEQQMDVKNEADREAKELAKQRLMAEKAQHKASGRYHVKQWIEAWMVDRDLLLEKFQYELANE